MTLNHWPTLPLAEVLTKNEDYVSIDSTARYQQVTVRLWGRGVSPRGEVLGVTIGSTPRVRVRAGQFILSKIDARNGALGIVPPQLEGAVPSNDFPTFDVYERMLRPGFLGWLLRTHEFVAACRRASEGTTNRVRLSEDRLLNIHIPLPNIDEQDRIVAKLDAAATRVTEAQRLCHDIANQADVLCRAILSDERHPHHRTAMHELVTVRPPDVTVHPQETYHFAGIYCFGRGMFRGQTRLGAEFCYNSLTRVRGGDFTYPKLMAWEGALCVVPPECDGLVVSTEFPVFEIDQSKVLPEVLDVYFRSPHVWPELSGTSKGTNVRRRRLNPTQFLAYRMPLPPRNVQLRLAKVREKSNAIKLEQREMLGRVEAMMPAILDRTFSGAVS